MACIKTYNYGPNVISIDVLSNKPDLPSASVELPSLIGSINTTSFCSHSKVQ